jgi:hypothetical protein
LGVVALRFPPLRVFELHCDVGAGGNDNFNVVRFVWRLLGGGRQERKAPAEIKETDKRSA